ncbi:hypothetical protein WMF30_25565 [Sorangium sp. So ce134]
MNRTRAWSAAAAPLWISAVALSACGGAPAAQAPAAPAPTSTAVMSQREEGSIETAEDALAALERAEGELDQALGARAGLEEDRAVTQAAPPGTPPPPPAAAPSPPRAAAPAEAAGSAGAPSQRVTTTGSSNRPAKKAEAEPVSATPCETACRALASMSRAAQHLCGLAGDADARCDAARTRVKSATDRVEARCPRCAEP